MSAIRDNRSHKLRRNVGGTNRERSGVRGPLCPEGAGAPERNSRQTQTRVQAIRRLRARGWTDVAIGKYLRVNRQVVSYLVKKYGIPKGPAAQRVRVKRPSEVELPPIDPAKAAAITAEKQAFWANGGSRSTWVHPYARRRSA